MTADSRPTDAPNEAPEEAASPACVMSFNASDPTGAGGIAGDVATIAAMGAHALPVVTAVVLRDTAEVFSHTPLEPDTIVEQARSILEDVTIAAWKVGFLGSAEGVERRRRGAVGLSRRAARRLHAQPGLDRGRRAAGVPRCLPRARAAADRGARRQPPDADRFPAARLGRRPAGIAARTGGRRRRTRRALRARHRRHIARPVHRQRARVAARGDHGREVRALRSRLRRRRRHAVGSARCAARVGRRPARSGRRGADLPRPGARRGFPPRHGQRDPGPVLLGAAARRRGRGGRRRRRRR